jgi:FkbM family methyltransferase
MALEVIEAKRLHSFEIASDSFEKLRANLGLRPNVTLNNFGLGEQNKVIGFYFYPDAPTRSTAYYFEDGYKKDKVSVAVVRGDDYVSQKGISSISFLKVDVEGMEIDVLRGFADTLKKGKIQAVQFEHGIYHIITRHFLRDFIELFQAVNYEVLRMLPNKLQPLHYEIERDENFNGENFLAVRADIERELLGETRA